MASKSFSRRQFLKGLTATSAGALVLSACAAPAAAPAAEAPSESAAQPEAVTIRALWSPGGIDNYMRALIDLYKEQEPNVEFEITVIEQEQKRATEVTIMSNDGAPDFAWINFGSGLTDRLADAGVITPLNDYYEQYGWWDYLPDHLHTHEYNDQIYHFSVASVTVPLMWYNKSLMAQIGMDPPTSMDELYAWADACHANDLEALAMGDRDGWPGFHMYQCLATRTVPLEDYEKILRFDKEEYYMGDYPGFEEAFQVMRDMETERVWAKGVLDMNDDQAKGLLFNGQAVAYESGIWVSGQAREALGEDSSFFMFPQIKDDIPFPLTASYADEYMLSSFSTVKDEVAAFFDFVLSKDGQKIVAKIGGGMPIRTDITVADLEGYADATVGEVTEMFGSGEFPVTDEIVTFWPAELYAMLRNNVQAAIGGQKTPAEIVAEFDELAAKFRAGEA